MCHLVSLTQWCSSLGVAAASCDTVGHGLAGPDSSSHQHLPFHVELGKRNLLPRDFQVQFDGAKVIDVNSHHLGAGCKQLFGLAGHAAYQDVSC